jgi:pyrroline-5-carboxylate reductase
MGAALVQGLVASQKASADRIRVFDPDTAKTEALRQHLGIVVAPSLSTLLEAATEVLLLAVKPNLVGQVLDAMAADIREDLLVISIAAGIPTTFLLEHIGKPARVVRAMPNAAATEGHSATALCKAGIADDNDLHVALELFQAMGTAVVVDEKLMNPVTALASSGLAYFFVIMEALTDAAVRVGMDRPTARQLTIQTMVGAAAMAKGGAPFSELKDRITSPGGTTIAALQVLERAGLRGTLMDAIEAATRRGEELASYK